MECEWSASMACSHQKGYPKAGLHARGRKLVAGDQDYGIGVSHLKGCIGSCVTQLPWGTKKFHPCPVLAVLLALQLSPFWTITSARRSQVSQSHVPFRLWLNHPSTQPPSEPLRLQDSAGQPSSSLPALGHSLLLPLPTLCRVCPSVPNPLLSV